MNRYFNPFWAIFTVGLFIWVGYSACIKNECVGVLCANNGVCVDGACACPFGYEGADCGTEWQRKFTGNWKAGDIFINDASGNVFSYDITIEGIKDSFYVFGLLDTLSAVKCKMTSRFVFTVAEQVMDSNITIKTGKGVLDSNTQIITGVMSVRLRDTVYHPVEIHNSVGVRKDFVAVKRDTTMTTRFNWKR